MCTLTGSIVESLVFDFSLVFLQHRKKYEKPMEIDKADFQKCKQDNSKRRRKTEKVSVRK